MTRNKKIDGKFAPLLQELGEDQRFILESTDLDKLLYVLIIFTCHMTHHAASKDPRFYKIRYGLRSKTGQIAASMRRLEVLYPKLSWGEKNLSLLNSATYKNEGCIEEEVEVEKKKKGKQVAKLPTVDFLTSLKSNPAYKDLDIDKELGKCQAWCIANKKMCSQRRFVNWINRADKPIQSAYVPKEKKPSSSCTACNGTGVLSDGKKCWCF